MVATTGKLNFAWIGDFESLKQFVSDTLKLDGTWSQPGGDKKLFTFGDSSISWRKNKNLLSLDGVKVSNLKRKLCKQICEHGKDNSELLSSEARHLDKLSDISADIENLKLGQLVNGEAIQTLSDSVSHVTSVISHKDVNPGGIGGHIPPTFWTEGDTYIIIPPTFWKVYDN